MLGPYNPQWKERTDCWTFSLASTHSLRTPCTALRPHAGLHAHIHPHMIRFYRRGRTNTYKARICEKLTRWKAACPALILQFTLRCAWRPRAHTGEELKFWRDCMKKLPSNPGGISPCNAEMPDARELHMCFSLTRLLHTLILLRSHRHNPMLSQLFFLSGLLLLFSWVSSSFLVLPVCELSPGCPNEDTTWFYLYPYLVLGLSHLPTGSLIHISCSKEIFNVSTRCWIFCSWQWSSRNACVPAA